MRIMTHTEVTDLTDTTHMLPDQKVQNKLLISHTLTWDSCFIKTEVSSLISWRDVRMRLWSSVWGLRDAGKPSHNIWVTVCSHSSDSLTAFLLWITQTQRRSGTFWWQRDMNLLRTTSHCSAGERERERQRDWCAVQLSLPSDEFSLIQTCWQMTKNSWQRMFWQVSQTFF